MTLTLVTAPVETPVSLAEAKSHLRILHADDDALITSLIASATGHFDGPGGILGRALVTQTWKQTQRFFGATVPLELRPVQSVTSVTYLDRNDATQTFADWRLVAEDGTQFVEPATDASWPATASRADAVTVTFVAGYGAAAAVPEPIRTAILMLVAHWFDGEEGWPEPVNRLVAPYRTRVA